MEEGGGYYFYQKKLLAPAKSLFATPFLWFGKKNKRAYERGVSVKGFV